MTPRPSPRASSDTCMLFLPHLNGIDLAGRTGAVANFEASVWQTTSVSKATAFHNISDTAGNSMAIRIATSEGGSASGGGWFASASGSSSSESNFESKKETVEERTRKYLEERETRSATVIECKSS